jgi:acyl carrier protein
MYVQGYGPGGLRNIADIDAALRVLLVEQLGVDEEEVTPEAALDADLGADSLDTVEIALAIESEFGVEVPDSDTERWQCSTVKGIADYLKERARRAQP